MRESASLGQTLPERRTGSGQVGYIPGFPTAALAPAVKQCSPLGREHQEHSLTKILCHGLSIGTQSCCIHQGLVRGVCGLDGACLKGAAAGGGLLTGCDRSPVYTCIQREGYGCHLHLPWKQL